jgi:hypothetical protein
MRFSPRRKSVNADITAIALRSTNDAARIATLRNGLSVIARTSNTAVNRRPCPAGLEGSVLTIVLIRETLIK